MPKLSYQQIFDRHLRILKGLQYESGLFAASSKEVNTGYDKSWLRDNFYECLAFEIIGDWETVEKTYDAILKVFLKHEAKIDAAIAQKPRYKHEYIHARFNSETFEEYWEEWGNKQNDSIGAILFRIGELEAHLKRSVLETDDHVRIVNKLVKYLQSIEYWHDNDNGVWEENEEVHASSVGACVAGLKAVKHIPQVEVPDELIHLGEDTLKSLLPRESVGKFADLAQLSLIYPYNVVNAAQRADIINNIEYHLLRKRGVIRYKGDYYYNRNPDGHSEEAEWTFGLSWLAIIHQRLGHHKRAQELLRKVISVDTEKGMPELYFSNSKKFNENTPLGWAESLLLVALHEVDHIIR